MKRRHLLLFALPLLLQAPFALSATDEENELALVYGTKPLVSIATGNAIELRRAPAVASVITAEDIKSMGAKDLDEVLETVPGLHVSRTSIRYAPTYVFRGIYNGTTNPQVLLLQNGNPTTTMYTGDKGSAWFGVPVENISRIEIIRGPGSALYGADAYAGVINIITKSATEIHGTELGGRIGSFNTWNTWLQHGGQWGALDVAAYLNIGATGGIQETIQADAQSLKDKTSGMAPVSLAPGSVNTGYNMIDGSLNLSFDKWRLRTYYKLRDKLGTGVGISSSLDPNSYGRAENISGDISWSDPQFAHDWSVKLNASAQYYEFTYPTNLLLYPAGTKFGANVFPNGLIGGPNSWDRQLRLSGNTTYSGFENHSLRIGLGHDILDLFKTRTIKNNLLSAAGAPTPDLAFNGGAAVDYTDRQPFITPHLRRVNYVYAQDEWNFARDWTLTAGIRHDNYSDFGGTTNPRLALVWDTALNLTTKLLYGQAFRAPSFNEQYGINPVANGNPNLKPETIRTLEAAFSWQAQPDAQVNLSLFHYDAQDIIRLGPNTASGVGNIFTNIGRQVGNGAELETVWDATRSVRLTSSYSYQNSIDKATNQNAGYAPRHHINLRGDWQLASGWLLAPQINWVADRKRPSGDTRAQVPDYTTVDLTLRTSRNVKHWNFSASVRNLFNATVLEPSQSGTTPLTVLIPNDLPMAPRSLWLQAIYNL
jgi:iron complex outermembrane receptor protein